MPRVIVVTFTAVAVICFLFAPASTSAGPVQHQVPTAALQVAPDAEPWQCGRSVYKPDGTRWICRFVDHFTGTRLDRSSWTVQESTDSASKPGLECLKDDPDNVRLSAGSLYLTARKESAPFRCASPWGEFTTRYTGGSVSTWDTLEQTFGRYEVRAKFPTATVSGIHSAIWLYPRKMTYGAWPKSGEIDIAEYYTRYPDRAVPYLHYSHASPDPVTNTRCMISNPRAFHTYTVEWTYKLITISYDGRRCLTHRIVPASPLTGSAPFNKPFVLLLTQTLGSGLNPFDPNKTPLPQTMEIDWVRVWK